MSQNSYGNTMVWILILSDLVQNSYRHGFFYVSTPFLLVMAAAAAAAADDPKNCFDAAKNQAASSLGVGATSFYSSSVRVKTLMGLDLFEVRFFFGEKFTKFDLALKQVIKNRSKVL